MYSTFVSFNHNTGTRTMFKSLLVAGLLPTVFAAPAPQMNYAENSGPVAGVNAPIPTVTAASGSLYGPESLLGEVAQPSPVSGDDSIAVSNYPLVNGQEADQDLGLYLDFNSVEKPQPIRGEAGQTDPGPSKPYTPQTVVYRHSKNDANFQRNLCI